METTVVGQNRKLAYILVSVILLLGAFQCNSTLWEGRGEIFTLMALVSTGLTCFAGLISLLTFSVKQDSVYLLLGTGLFGTGLLEAYRMVIASSYFERYLVWLPPQAAAWSLSAGRLFFSIVMLLTLWLWIRSQDPENREIGKKKIILGLGVLALGGLFFFLLGPLPPAYQKGSVVGRPQEFIAGIFFSLSAIGYYKKGRWTTNSLEHWILLSLIVLSLSQIAYLPFSQKAGDLTTLAAQFLKQCAYLFLLIGLVKNIYQLLQKLAGTKQELIQTHLALEKQQADIEEEARNLVESLAYVENHNHRLEDLKRAMLNVVEDLKEEQPKSETHRELPNNVSALAISKR